MATWAPKLSSISKERVSSEIQKLMDTSRPLLGFDTLKDVRLVQQFWPHWSLSQDRQAWQTFRKFVLEMGPALNLSSFFAFMALLQGEELGLNLQNHSRLQVQWEGLLESQPLMMSRQDRANAEALLIGLGRLLHHPTKALLTLNEDIGPLFSEFSLATEKLGLLQPGHTGQLVERFLSLAGTEGRLPKAYLSGRDFIELGWPQTAQLGSALEELYIEQLDGKIQSEKEAQNWALEHKP